MVRKGEQLSSVTDEEITYFYTENELVSVHTHAHFSHRYKRILQPQVQDDVVVSEGKAKPFFSGWRVKFYIGMARKSSVPMS